MPTPSDSAPRRSVFGNYRPTPDAATELSSAAAPVPPVAAPGRSLQERIDEALARAFLHRFLAHLFDYPGPAAWEWITAPATRDALRSAARVLAATGDTGFPARVEDALTALAPEAYRRFNDDYIVAFGHGARGSCPINEIEYGDLRADPLFQPHRLADIAAFYQAFGLEVTEDGGERLDHLSAELEFMAVLALRDAHALEHQADDEDAGINRTAQARFLREHLGRWVPAFARRVERALSAGPWAAPARLLLDFVLAECRRHTVPAGSEDLLLRPADDSESLCASCGLDQLPPGATAAAA